MKIIASALFLASASLSVAAANFPPLERKPVLDVPVPAANPPVKLIRGAWPSSRTTITAHVDAAVAGQSFAG